MTRKKAPIKRVWIIEEREFYYRAFYKASDGTPIECLGIACDDMGRAEAVVRKYFSNAEIVEGSQLA